MNRRARRCPPSKQCYPVPLLRPASAAHLRCSPLRSSFASGEQDRQGAGLPLGGVRPQAAGARAVRSRPTNRSSLHAPAPASSTPGEEQRNVHGQRLWRLTRGLLRRRSQGPASGHKGCARGSRGRSQGRWGQALGAGWGAVRVFAAAEFGARIAHAVRLAAVFLRERCPPPRVHDCLDVFCVGATLVELFCSLRVCPSDGCRFLSLASLSRRMTLRLCASSSFRGSPLPPGGMCCCPQS